MKRVKNSSSSSSTFTNTISGLLLLLVSCASLAIVGLINSAGDVVLHDSTTTMSRELSTEKKLSAKKVELHTDDTISDSTNNNSNHGPTFVFTIGIEGTGHHFIYEVLSKSPNRKYLTELGICGQKGDRQKGKTSDLYKLSALLSNAHHTGVFDMPSTAKKDIDAAGHYNKIIELLKTMHQKFNDKHPLKKGTPFYVPINANACASASMISYPNFTGKDRPLQNFNLDIFYNACTDANVDCKHIYIYRDPYDVLKSTTTKRHFNEDTFHGIKLYTSELQQIHSQMMSYPDHNLGCFGFLDVNGHTSNVDWKRFGNLFGWKERRRAKNYRRHTEEMKRTHKPVAMSDAKKLQLVPQHLKPLMQSFEGIHNRVKDLCYSTLESNMIENGGVGDDALHTHARTYDIITNNVEVASDIDTHSILMDTARVKDSVEVAPAGEIDTHNIIFNTHAETNESSEIDTHNIIVSSHAEANEIDTHNIIITSK